MQKITAFMASDGSLFTSEQECAKHEEPLAIGREVDKFIEAGACPYTDAGPGQSISRKAIIAWEAWCRSGRPGRRDDSLIEGVPATNETGQLTAAE